MTEHRVDHFYAEFGALLRRHNIRSMVLTNRDNNDMGKAQLYKIIEPSDLEEDPSGFGRCFVIAFSSTGQILCQNCREKHGQCSHQKQEES